MQLEIKSKETIKPCHPTPADKKVLKLSLIDQFSPRIFVRTFFFYLANSTQQNHVSIANTTIEQLKISLSKTLTSYYPFAGRLSKDGQTIDCNDEGIEVLEAHFKCQVGDILEPPRLDALSKLFPISGEEAISSSNIHSLVLIQFTTFDCGGMVIGVCFSHKIADARSMATFMNDWASVTCDPKHEPIPQFNGASLFPPCDDRTTICPILPERKAFSTRRLVFDVSKIDSLRNNNNGVDSLKGRRPTRFETVSALICKSILGGLVSLGSSSQRILSVVVNLRTRIDPPVSENHIGNFSLPNVMDITSSETTLHGLVAVVKEGMAKFLDKFVHQLHSQHERSSEVHKTYLELERLLANTDTEMLLFSSWCRFPFYQVDFGFEEPLWASVFPNPGKMCVFLCDSRDGSGIEAWVNLEDQLMHVFEHDSELLGFASLNPSPLELHERS